MKFEIPTAISRQIRRDLIQSHDANFVDFKSFISSQRYAFTSATPHTITPYSKDELFSACAGNTCKFARASIESLSGIITEPTFPKNIAWIIVRTYYAAFYAAHAILGFFGKMCVNIDGHELSKIDEVSQITGHNFSKKGFYEAEVANTTHEVILTALKNSHEDTWKTLKDTITFIRDQVPSIAAPKSSREESILILTDTLNHLTDNGRFNGGNYLSYVRNQVQYRFEFKAWYPYGVAKGYLGGAKVEDIAKACICCNFTKISGTNELTNFFNCSFSICQIMFSLFEEILSEGIAVSSHIQKDYNKLSALISA